MTEYVFIFSFSPIQEFISEARRLGDLYAGSRLLSNMAKAAVSEIEKLPGNPKLIYPLVPANEDEASLPNKLTALISDTAGTPDTVAQKLKEAINSTLQREAGEALRYFASKVGGDLTPDSTWKGIWHTQLSSLLEFYWAAAPIENDNYTAAYEKASRAFDAAKRTRAFPQMEQKGRKDSLSGKRSALHREGIDQPEYWEKVSKRFGGVLIRSGEALDAFGLIKRFGFSKEAGPRFANMTTATVATSLFRASAPREAIEDYIAFTKGGGRYLHDLLYTEEIKDRQRLVDDYGFSKEWLDENHHEMQKRLDALYNTVGFKPSNYYAIMYMDGDSMGRHIQECESLECHEEISKRMGEFASRAREVIEDKGCFQVYIGGDDVMALAPLRMAIPLAQALADTFTDVFSGGDFTVSAGIAVVHRTYPLYRALGSARTAERMSKDIKGKSTLSLHVIKRSGRVATFASKWGVGSGWKNLGEAFTSISDHMRSGRLSGKFAYDVTDFAQRIAKPPDTSNKGNKTSGGGVPEGMREAFQAEIKRLIKRHKSKDSNIDPEGLAKKITAWTKVMHGGDDVPAIGHWLQFARFVAGEEREER